MTVTHGSPRAIVAVLAAILVATAACANAAPAARPAGSTAASPADTSAAKPSASVAAEPATTPEAAGAESDLEGEESSPTTEPAGSATAAPTESVAPAQPAEPFSYNLFRKGDYVAQYTFEWCVGASIQMAINLSGSDSTTSRSAQQKFWERARDNSSSPFGGANPRGWVAVLNAEGVGPYRLVSIPDYGEALRVAATAIRETKRPVGLVMWRGRHAWVMSGFTSTADPRTRNDFSVTGIRVLDPLYPHGSRVWGPSPKPNSLLKPSVLDDQFVIRDRGRVNLGVPPGYLLVLPVAA